MEVWKSVKGYEGLYEISNYGRVKSLRFINNNVNKEKVTFIAITDNGNGYKIGSLSDKGKRKNQYIHRLVAQHFLPNDLNKPIVNHLDRDTSNNKYDNLQWCTQRENILYSANIIGRDSIIEKSKATRLRNILARNDEYTLQIIAEYKGGNTIRKLSDKLPLCRKTISKILKDNNIYIRRSNIKGGLNYEL
jgi:hypothetical protein